ncbi:hypothetical protein H5410_029058 [Solanum commersonii]|uniref:S-protein homolog n=1 Tax=Solanum commersonii TaxID=4109 RepID=A0A9J5Z9E4_SOLCO|nr:hypothetical protein H5410_029058 [Solanum commersonii]
MSLIKNFCILLLTLYVVNICSEARVVENGIRFEVHIISDLPNNNIPLWFHCASKNHDFGYQLLKVGDDFNFQHLKDYCGDPEAKIRTCYWKVQEDGFYLGSNPDITEKMHDWQK